MPSVHRLVRKLAYRFVRPFLRRLDRRPVINWVSPDLFFVSRRESKQWLAFRGRRNSNPLVSRTCICRLFYIQALVITPWVLTLVEPVWAAQANPNVINVKQPDGQRVQLRMYGSKRHWWYEDTRGYPVLHRSGRYVYQTNVDPAAASDLFEVGKVDPEVLNIRRMDVEQRRGALRDIAREGLTERFDVAREAEHTVRVPAIGTVRNLVVLIRFANHGGRVLPSQSDFHTLFNADGGHPVIAPTGSVRDLYLENSYGQFTLNSTVLDWYTVSNTEQYYADGQSGSHVLWEAIVEALINADVLIDFTDFDSDNDGAIDAITLVHSGYGAEWGGTDADGTPPEDRIWSHKWALSPAWVAQEGVSVTTYNINPGLWSTSGTEIGRIGTISHELGHFFGLPDLYDTDGGGAGIGSWGLMANSWGFTGTQLNPPHLSAWSKIRLGWAEPTVISETGFYSLAESELNPEFHRIDAGFPDGEYLLLENRQPTGFEATMPQGGVVVWHIDETKTNNQQSTYPEHEQWPGAHYKVAILQADGNYDLERDNNRGDTGDPYVSDDRIDSSTTPGTHSYQSGSLVDTNIVIASFSASDSTMSFELNLPPPAPSFTAPTGGEQWFTNAPALVTWDTNGAPTGTVYDLEFAEACTAPVNFNDGIENGSASWTSSSNGGSHDWSIAGTNPHQGQSHWFARNVATVTEQTLLTTSTISVPTVNPRLSFWHAYDIETSFDGGVVELSTDNVLFVDLGSRMRQSGYDQTLSDCCSNPLSGRSAFTGDSGGYVNTIVDLSDFAGQHVYIRFRLGTDSLVGADGWYLDNVVVFGEPDVAWTTIASGVDPNAHTWDTPTIEGSEYCLRLQAANPYGTSQRVISELFELVGANPGDARIDDPVAGSQLPAAEVSFAWSYEGNSPVDEWWIYAGSALGKNNYYNSGNLGSSTADVVSGLPINGSTVFVRLWYRFGGVGAWSFIDETYTAAASGAAPEILAPAAGSVLGDTAVDLEWSMGDSGADEYWVYAGSVLGSRSYFDSGSLGPTEIVAMSGLPANGSLVYVRLWYRGGSNPAWRFIDVVYTATGMLPIILDPAPGVDLSGDTVPFQWADNGIDVVAYWLYAGSVPGGRDYYNSANLGATTTATVTALPVDGSVVYVRLWYREDTDWEFRDFTYRAAH